MKIGIFTECYHPVLNGVVVSIDTFKEDLAKMGHEYYIFATDCPGFDKHEEKVYRSRCLLPFKPKGGRYPMS